MKLWKKLTTDRGLNQNNLFLFLTFVVVGGIMSAFPIPDESSDYEEPDVEEDEPTAEEIIEGLKDGSYIAVANEQGGTTIYKKV